MTEIEKIQRMLCERYEASFAPPESNSKVGVSRDLFFGILPLNGLRHPIKGDACGWYLWSGETLSQANRFFEPLHVSHLFPRCPKVLPYLALPRGWRFLIAEGCEDVWYDETLLVI